MTITSLQESLGRSLVEREDDIRDLLLALIAQEHMLLVGPPGTGKSLACRSIARGVSGIRYCERLLSPTSPSESVFGPVSLSALRDDRYEHIQTGSATDCEILFLDEFFRASDAIRDSLLHLLGPERQALIGTEQVKAPLMTCIGAANTWAESADQAAILDRWLIRRVVRPVSRAGLDRLMFEDLPPVEISMSLDELRKLQDLAPKVPIGTAAKDALRAIIDELIQAGIRPSDRRCRAAVKIVRAAAVLDPIPTAEVQPKHLEPLTSVLWDTPDEQPAKAAEIILKIANPAAFELQNIIQEVESSVSSIDKADAGSRLGGIQKLTEIRTRVAAIVKAGGNGRAKRVFDHVQREIIKLHAISTGMSESVALAAMGLKEES